MDDLANKGWIISAGKALVYGEYRGRLLVAWETETGWRGTVTPRDEAGSGVEGEDLADVLRVLQIRIDSSLGIRVD